MPLLALHMSTYLFLYSLRDVYSIFGSTATHFERNQARNTSAADMLHVHNRAEHRRALVRGIRVFTF